jgi:hypothetical protein
MAIAASLTIAGWIADDLISYSRRGPRFIGHLTRDLVLIDPLPLCHCMVIHTSWIVTITSYTPEIGNPTEEGVRSGSIPDWIRQIAEGNAIDTIRTDVGWPLRFARVERTSENWMLKYPPPTIHGLLRIGPIPFATRPLFPGFLLLVALVYVFMLAAERALCIPHKMRVRRRRHRGCCASCGYDLIGIDAAMCPECGLTHA